MSDGEVLETGAENIKTFLKRIQDRVRDEQELHKAYIA